MTPSNVTAVICLAFAFAGLVVMSVALANAMGAMIVIVAAYLAAAILYATRKPR